MGIEPTSSAWKAEVLPLNYTRGDPGAGIHRGAQDPRRPRAADSAFNRLRDKVADPRTFARILPVRSNGAECLHFDPLFALVEGVGFEPT